MNELPRPAVADTRPPDTGRDAASLSARLGDAARRMVTLGVLALGTLSLVVIVWLLWQRAEAELRSVGSELRLALRTDLRATLGGLEELSRRTLVRNALVDPAGRGAYLDPTLREFRQNQAAVGSVWLTDHQGAALARSQESDGDATALAEDLARQAVAQERPLQRLHRVGERWRLLQAFPVVFAATGTVEGAVLADLDLATLFRPPLGDLADGLMAEVTVGSTVVLSSATEHRSLLRLAWLLTDEVTPSALPVSLALSTPWLHVLAPALWVALAYVGVGLVLLTAFRRRALQLAEQSVLPLRRLRDAARRVATEGLAGLPDLSRHELEQGGTEVTSLAESFHAMLAQLLQAQTSLEQTVLDRTAELAQAKHRLDSTLASLSDGVYSLSLQRDELLYASPPVRRLLGLPDDAVPMLRDTLAQLLGAEQARAMDDAFEAALRNGSAVSDWCLADPVRGTRWLENRMTVVRDAQGLPLRVDGILSDITDTVRSRQERDRAEDELRLRDRALASTGNGVLILAMRAGQPAQSVYANPAMAQIAGSTVQAMMRFEGLGLRQFVVDDALNLALVDCVKRQRDVRVSTRLRRTDGTVIWTEVTISPMVPEVQQPGHRWTDHVVLVVDDVTERRRQKALLGRVVDSVSEVIFQADTAGRWTYLNPAWHRITGFEVAASLGQPILDHVCPSDLQQARRFLAPLLAGEIHECEQELRYRTLEGGYRWLAMHVQRLLDEDGQPAGYTGTLTDVTTRRAAEADLRLRNRAIDASTNGIVLTDVRAPGAPVVFVNDGFTRLTGYSATEALGRSCAFLQGDDTDQPGVAAIRDAIAVGQPCRTVLRNYRKDGQRFDNDLAIAPLHDEATGEVTHYVGVLTDVTAQLSSERLLRDQFARLDTILALSPDAFVSFDGRRRVVSTNPAFEALTGLASEVVIGLPEGEFEALLDSMIVQRNPPGMAHWADDVDASLSAGAAGRSEILVLRGLPPKVVICSRRDCDAPDVSRVMQLRDITRETEVDRMKSEFLSTAAHELRTPMASIRGFSDLLMMRKFDEVRTRDILQTINRQSIWLTDMVNELLDLARIEARKGKDFHLDLADARALVQASVDALMVPGDARKVALDLPEDAVPVRVDCAKFQQAVTNVVANAYKYSPQGGSIALSVRTQAGADGQPWVSVSVRDEGIGMKPEHARRAFERFFRADASGNIPGTGLGLALVKEIIELHGGRAELDSEWGRGTTVTLWVPAWREGTAEAGVEPVGEASADQTGGRTAGQSA